MKSNSIQIISISTGTISETFQDIQESVFIMLDIDIPKERNYNKKKEKDIKITKKDISMSSIGTIGSIGSIGLGIGIADITPTAIWRKLNGTSTTNTNINNTNTTGGVTTATTTQMETDNTDTDDSTTNTNTNTNTNTLIEPTNTGMVVDDFTVDKDIDWG